MTSHRAPAVHEKKQAMHASHLAASLNKIVTLSCHEQVPGCRLAQEEELGMQSANESNRREMDGWLHDQPVRDHVCESQGSSEVQHKLTDTECNQIFRLDGCFGESFPVFMLIALSAG